MPIRMTISDFVLDPVHVPLSSPPRPRRAGRKSVPQRAIRSPTSDTLVRRLIGIVPLSFTIPYATQTLVSLSVESGSESSTSPERRPWTRNASLDLQQQQRNSSRSSGGTRSPEKRSFPMATAASERKRRATYHSDQDHDESDNDTSLVHDPIMSILGLTPKTLATFNTFILQDDGLMALEARERLLCRVLRIHPRPYLRAKEQLLAEAEVRPLLKKSQAQKVVRMDVNKTSKLFECFVAWEWIGQK